MLACVELSMCKTTVSHFHEGRMQARAKNLQPTSPAQTSLGDRVIGNQIMASPLRSLPKGD